MGSASSVLTRRWSYVRMAQLRSLAFLMTADRLAFITTNVISRTIASNLLFSTDIRKGSTRRVPSPAVEVDFSSINRTPLGFPFRSFYLDHKIPVLVHGPDVVAREKCSERVRIDQAGSRNLRAVVQ